MTAPGPWNARRQAVPRLYTLAWSFYLLLAASAIVWIGMRRNATIDGTLFFDPSRWWMDIPLGAAAGGAMIGVWELVGRRFTAARRFEELLRGVLGSLDAGQAIGLALLSGFAEELFFRGLGVTVLSTFGPVVAIAGTAIVFGLAHGILVALPPLVVFAVGLAWIRLRAGSLWPCIIAHSAYNAIGLAAAALTAA